MSKEELDGNEKPVRKRMHPILPSKSIPGTRPMSIQFRKLDGTDFGDGIG